MLHDILCRDDDEQVALHRMSEELYSGSTEWCLQRLQPPSSNLLVHLRQAAFVSYISNKSSLYFHSGLSIAQCIIWYCRHQGGDVLD